MRKILCSIIILFSVTWASAGPIADETAQTLLAKSLRLRHDLVEILYQVEGEAKTSGGLTAKKALEVTFYVPTRDTRRRELKRQIFFYDENLGWFFTRKKTDQVKPYLCIYSEKKGEIDLDVN